MLKNLSLVWRNDWRYLARAADFKQMSLVRVELFGNNHHTYRRVYGLNLALAGLGVSFILGVGTK